MILERSNTTPMSVLRVKTADVVPEQVVLQRVEGAYIFHGILSDVLGVAGVWRANFDTLDSPRGQFQANPTIHNGRDESSRPLPSLSVSTNVPGAAT